mmetsp:Transcript_64123/g.105304  ORF Transcript_64123/g.105304 Transcript_64123/m.105304 type:complete len:281 (+) Transcript_64123:27-869(+)
MGVHKVSLWDSANNLSLAEIWRLPHRSFGPSVTRLAHRHASCFEEPEKGHLEKHEEHHEEHHASNGGHEFAVPKMPKTPEPSAESDAEPAVEPDVEVVEVAEPEGETGEADYEVEMEGDLTSPAPPAEAEPEVVPLMDEDLKLADVRFDSKVDPQLERIAEQVNQKIDLVEERLLGDRLQNVVVPLPASSASQDASSVHVFLGSPSSTPDVGSPLDQVNQLLLKANNIQKGLATSNLQKFTKLPELGTSGTVGQESSQVLFPWLGCKVTGEHVRPGGDFL